MGAMWVFIIYIVVLYYFLLRVSIYFYYFCLVNEYDLRIWNLNFLTSYTCHKILKLFLSACGCLAFCRSICNSGINFVYYWFDSLFSFEGKEYETDQVFVSNLPPSVTEEAIKERFGSIGIIKVSLLTNGFSI